MYVRTDGQKEKYVAASEESLELDESWTVKYHNTLCFLALSDHYTPSATGYFHLVKIRENL
jgi:hypothetical protein